MDQPGDSTWPPAASPPKPLQLRKQSNQHHVAESKQPEQNYNSHQPQSRYQSQPKSISHPPRTSSLRRSDAQSVLDSDRRRQKSREPRESPGVEASAQSSMNHSQEDHNPNSTGETTSLVEIVRALRLNNDSSPILGNFIPIELPPRMNSPDNHMNPRHSPDVLAQITQSTNPYEFEPPTPRPNESHQTTMTDFVKRHESSPACMSTPRFGHVKNVRSDGNTIPICYSYKPSPIDDKLEVPRQRTIHKSGSSPNLTALPFPAQGQQCFAPDLSTYAGEFSAPVYPIHLGRQIVDDEDRRGRQRYEEYDSQTHSNQTPRKYASSPQRYSPSHELSQSHSEDRRGRQRHEEYDSQTHSNQIPHKYASSPQRHSPSHELSQSHGEDQGGMSPAYHRYMARSRSPTKKLRDVHEMDEFSNGRQEESPNLSIEPPRRSRSPMKKMFGEHGWLGKSPDEAEEFNAKGQGNSGGKQKKTGMMEKLKIKFEGFAEKAEMSPKRGSRSSQGKSAKIPNLTTSLAAVDQAKIFIELEFMLSQTANRFLMDQFSLGRMNPDAFKKTVETWRSKGRPSVIEFMYDQITQRDLVAANQLNFRFHGEVAGDNLRVNSMLYNWKQVANQMAIRTFCNADTVVLKLLFDIGQILELLGASESTMLRVQDIRSRVDELIRLVHEKRQRKTNTQEGANSQEYVSGQEQAREVNSSGFGISSFGDPYSGLKLVPDHYVEPN
ncbi:hypothetical protein G7Y89_g436 [Cudoniella acicularis]|uniref:Uncharacterized protein n=1 Tax=Cudoniella acicularis TaxID=354080 RepID=A0A8H4RY18_9HELO|nr:hypothetical protein G7Y89_g436 [Cudoniella acicularis]